MRRRILDAAIVVAGAALLLTAAGGLDLVAGPIQLRLHDWTRPAILLAVALIFWISGVRPLTKFVRGLTPLAQLALLLAIGVFYIRHFVPVAGGLDSYGYVGAAALLKSGHFSEPQRLVSLLPFENASAAAAQLGFVPGPDHQTSVPRFPLGLPIVMAGFHLFGSNAAFYVPLVMAFVLAGLAYVMAGLPAALLILISPLVFVYGTQPMSDVPATCWLFAATVLMLGSRRLPLLAAGCAGMAVLTRPALLVAAGVLGLVSMDRQLRDSLKYFAVLAGFVGLQLLLNWTMYGRATESGYGPASHMFELSVSRVVANASNFGKWLTYSHTPLFWIMWPAALYVLRQSRWAWQVSAVAAGALAPYFFYLVFDDWESSRFILPAVLLVLVLTVRAITVAIPKATMAAVAITIFVFGAATVSYRFLDRESAFTYEVGESKYPLTGAWFREHTSDRAVVLAGLHSGSIRYYANRETLRWDQMPAGSIAPTIQALVSAGYEPYLVVDTGGEMALFTERFNSEPRVKIEQVGRVRVVNIYRFLSAS